jgi:RNA polymerase sigma factor (sigma-70 family)
MTVVLWDINVKKRSQNTLNDQSVKDWTLDDYYEVAQRTIGAFASAPLASSMLRNEDAISFVAEHLMYGAHRWSETGGRSVNAYLNQCAIWAIYRWIALSKKANAESVVSLNRSRGPDSRRQLYEMTTDERAAAPEDDMVALEQSDTIASLLENAGLTERQKHCIEVVYVQGKKPSDVARDLGITRQAVDQCLTKGIKKIRVAIDGKEETLFA